MKVRIKRSIKAFKVGEIDVDKIWNVKWDNISGGWREKHFGYALYGNIDYKDAYKLVDCSGEHAEIAYNGATIMIPQSLNREKEYKKGYMDLARKAGDKPKSRSKGQKPCSKRILEILKVKKQIKRIELFDIMYEENYKHSLIRNTLKRLSIECRIVIKPEDGHYWKKQIVYLSDETK